MDRCFKNEGRGSVKKAMVEEEEGKWAPAVGTVRPLMQVIEKK